VGVSTAYFPTRHRFYDPAIHSISILEASGIAAGSSGKGGGFIASWATPKCIAPLSFGLHKRLAQEHGGDKTWGYRVVTAAEIELQAQKEHAQGQQPAEDFERSPPVDAPAALDWLCPKSIKAYREVGTPKDSGQVHPFLLTTRLAQLAAEKGVCIITGLATAINYSEDGSKVRSVTYREQDESHVLDATDVLVAAGPWSPKLLPQVKLQAPKGHSIVVKPSMDISPYILFTETRTPATATPLMIDIYPRPPDPLNGFDSLYASGPDHYDVPLPERASDTTVEPGKIDDVWKAVSSVVSREIREGGEVVTTQACYKAQIRKHTEGEEVGPMVGPVDEDNINGLWLATGLDEWGIQNGPGVGLVVSEMILEGGKATSADVEPLNPKHWL